MAGQRFLFEALAIPQEQGAKALRALETGRFDVKRHRRQVVTVKAGKTGLVVLDDKALSAATDAKFLLLRSGVEGVEWWPIDSATPSIDPDTRPFGPLLDLAAPVYVHAHDVYDNIGAHAKKQSESGANYGHVLGTANNTMYATLPCFQSYEIDQQYRDSPPVGTAFLFAPKINTTQATNVSHGGKVIEGPVKGSGTTISYSTGFMYLIGKDGRYNLGTAGDGLEFHLAWYVDNKDALRQIANAPLVLQIYCYPYTDVVLASTQVKDPQDTGWSPWATNDEMICREGREKASVPIPTAPPVNNHIGWDFTLPAAGPNQGAYFRTQADVGPAAVNGWQVTRFPKGNFESRAAIAPAQAGSPTWSRVTQISFRSLATLITPYINGTVYIANLFFGPRPGLRRVLRPFELTTDQPWSALSIPAVGIQNPLTLDAEVEVVYGGL